MTKNLIAMAFAAGALLGASGETETVNGIEWEYYTSYSYGATITRMNGTTSDVTIPYMLGGYEVRCIGNDAFRGNSYLRRVTIPWHVREIGSSAFYSCVNLYEVKLAEGLEQIDSEAFFGCQALQSVEIPSSVNYIYSGAFAMCGIRWLTLNKWCPYRLSEILGDTAKLLTSLTLGAETDRNIGQSFFDGCNALSSVSIAATHEKYKVVNGLVLSKDGKELVAVPPGRSSITIPSTVTSLGWQVVDACSNLIDTASIPGVKKLGDWVVGYDEDNPPKSVNLQGVRAVRNYAFEYCYTLASLTIPASVKIIGEDAFEGCYRLKTISVAKGNTAFKYTGGMLLTKNGKRLITVSRNVTTVAVPNGVQTIDAAAFVGCTKLTKVSLPKTVRYIGGEYIIIGCTKLKSFTVASGNKWYKSKGGMLLEWWDEGWGLVAVPPALVNVAIPQGAKWISSCAFIGCSKVTSVTIPASMTEVDKETFECLPKLKAFKVAAKNKCFKASKGLLLSKNGKKLILVPNALTSVSVPAGVTRIEAYAFCNCEKLKKVTIPASVTSIDRYAGLKGLPYDAYDTRTIRGLKMLNGWVIDVDNEGRDIDTDADGNKVDPGFDGVLNLTGAIGIADYAFGDRTCVKSGNCKTNCVCFCGITGVIIPPTLKYIGFGAFLNCHNLSNVVMPEGVRTIGEAAFGGCERLSEVSIPESVTSIGKDAFAGCCEGEWHWERNDETGEDEWIEDGESLYDTITIPGAKMVDGWVVSGDLPDDDEWDGSLDLTGVRGIAAYAFGGDSVGSGHSGGLCDGSTLPESYSPGLVSVTIPATVKGIGGYAFGYCTDLRQVTMPLSVKSRVASTAFKGCSANLKFMYLATVTFNANGGEMEGPSLFSVPCHDALRSVMTEGLPVPTRKGYDFKDWFTAKSKGSKISLNTPVSEDTIYYAQWRPRQYKVSVKATPGGKAATSGSYDCGSLVKLTATPSKGYVFVRWDAYDDTEELWPEYAKQSRQAQLSLKMPPGNLTLQAVFAKASADSAPVLSVAPDDAWYIEDDPGREISVAADSLSYPAVTLSGAPAGIGLVRVPDTDDRYVLKVTDAAKMKPGVYTVKVTAKNRAGKSASKTVKIVTPNSSGAVTAGLMAGIEPSTLKPYTFEGGMKMKKTLADLGVEVFQTNGWKLVSVTGLPTGLSWNGTAIVGAASKTGVFTVTFTMKKTVKDAKTKKTKTYTSTATATFAVDTLLPGEVAGTYNGFANTNVADTGDEGDSGDEGDGGEDDGEVENVIYTPIMDGWASAVKVTVTTAGKITVNVGGVAITGNGFDSVSNGVYAVALKKTQKITKGSLKGKSKVWEAYIEIDINAACYGRQVSGWFYTYITGFPSMTAPAYISAQRNAFGDDADAEAMAAAVAGTRKFALKSVKGEEWQYDLMQGGNALSVVAKSNGAAAIAGKIGSVKVSGASTLEIGETAAEVRFFTSKFAVEIVYTLEDGEVASVSGRVWRK